MQEYPLSDNSTKLAVPCRPCSLGTALVQDAQGWYAKHVPDGMRLTCKLGCQEKTALSMQRMHSRPLHSWGTANIAPALNTWPLEVVSNSRQLAQYHWANPAVVGCPESLLPADFSTLCTVGTSHTSCLAQSLAMCSRVSCINCCAST